MIEKYIGIGESSEFATFHPVVNFSYFCAVIAIAMFSMNPLFLAITFVTGFMYSAVLGGVKTVKANMMIAIPVIIITMIINPIANHRGVTVLFYLNGNPFTLEAIIYGIASASMLVGILMWFSCFNKIMTGDKIIYLFGRVIPVIALLLSMCFRFIPLLKARFHEIHDGQKYMGRDFPKKSVIKKIRQLGKEISILIAWSLEASIETADSMEARGYGLKGRTSFHIFKFSKRDRNLMIIIGLLTAVVLGGCALHANTLYYYPAIRMVSSWAVTIPAAICYFALLILPMIIDIKGEQRWQKLSLEM